MTTGRPALLGCLLAIACAILLGDASQALAHAQLLGTSPASGAVLPVQPKQVIFEFNQNVGGTLGAVFWISSCAFRFAIWRFNSGMLFS